MRSPWRVVGMAAGLVAGVAAQAPVFDYPALLQRLAEVDWLAQPPVAGERCVQWSSYDRASHKGPGDPGAWYANNDRGQHLRVVDNGGAKEFVMVDAKGPGCIARIWSANPSGTLHFDVDGTRVWSVDFLALCSGKVDGIPEPVAGMRSKGGNCYLPIPFQKSLVVSCTAGDCYYAFDVVHWPAGAKVPSFTSDLLDGTAAVASTLAKGFTSRLAAQWRSADGFCEAGRDGSTIVVPPRRTVYELSLAVDGAMTGAARVELLRRVVLVATAGTEELIRVPVADFFACGTTGSAWRGYLAGVGDSGRAYCHWPMPFPAGGELRLEVEGGVGAAAVKLYTHSKAFPLFQKAGLLFRASYHLAKGTPTRPFSDHLVLDAKGQGRFVGCSLLVRNPSRIWWGEGDEKFTVDGEAFPSWFGTGTEDYFGYAWCDPTPFQSPFHAQVECQGPMNFGFTQLHRTHVLDSVPFQQSCRFELERWHWVEDIRMDYATVAYWYGAAGAVSGLPPVPAAAERELPKLPQPPMFVAAGVLEGEDLRVLTCPSGVHEAQGMWFLEKTFSKDGQLWWRDGKPGFAIVLAVPVPAAGRYRVTAAFCQADDYGIVQCSLAGQPLGEPFDGYSERVRSSGPRELGVVELTAGDAELRLLLTGHHTKAKPRGMVGLDYVKLEKLP